MPQCALVNTTLEISHEFLVKEGKICEQSSVSEAAVSSLVITVRARTRGFVPSIRGPRIRMIDRDTRRPLFPTVCRSRVLSGIGRLRVRSSRVEPVRGAFNSGEHAPSTPSTLISSSVMTGGRSGAALDHRERQHHARNTAFHGVTPQ